MSVVFVTKGKGGCGVVLSVGVCSPENWCLMDDSS